MEKPARMNHAASAGPRGEYLKLLTWPRLRPVAAGELAKPRNLTVVQAAADGSHREMLVAIRARIAQTVEATDCPPVALAALVKTLQSISKELSV